MTIIGFSATVAALDVTCTPVLSVTLSWKEYVPGVVDPVVTNVYVDDVAPVIGEKLLADGAFMSHW